MPSINIKEVDISPVATADVTTNAVYVPGYARTGPVGEPTLCNTLAEFQKVFGSSPYLFEDSGTSFDITVGGVTKTFSYTWNKGTAEPSYVYAADLLRLGLPIIFERVDPNEGYVATGVIKDEDNETDTADLASVYPGSCGTYIHYSLSSNTYTIDGVDYDGYVLSVWRVADPELGISPISPVQTKFTLSEELNAVYPQYALYLQDDGSGITYTDNSGLVTIMIQDSTRGLYPVEDEHLSISSQPANKEYTPDLLYNHVSSTKLEYMKDKNNYVFKYITLGGYPSIMKLSNSTTDTTFSDILLNVATSRKDITALVDYDISWDNGKDASAIRDMYDSWISPKGYVDDEDQGNYASAFTPWGTYKSQTLSFMNSNEIVLTPSFAYLSALAQSTQTYANWYAVAGVTRGFVPNLVGISFNMSDSVSNAIQPKDDVAINPIVNVKPYGFRIWGSRTLRNNFLVGGLTATSFLNIRQLANDVKRAVYVASKECMFEPDDDVLWINYKSKITPLLDRMKGNRGLTDYTIRRVATEEKATLKAVIRLYCIDPVENFDITLELTDGQVVTSE